jgi:polysaccharide export outer membrane protein
MRSLIGLGTLLLLLLTPAVQAEERYRIKPNDVLEIFVYGEDQLSQETVVLPNGNISYPLIGELLLGRLTTEEAASLISEDLSYYFSNPIVSVIFKKYINPKVSVLGSVRNPGLLDFQRGMRLTDYIALAGWTTPDADLGRCTVVRKDENRRTVLEVNLEDILREGWADQNLELEGWDVVYVPRKSRVRWNDVFYVVTAVVSVVSLYLNVTR